MDKNFIKIGTQPINWSNDDFHELGGDISLETCLSQMSEAGYIGTELGHKFSKDPGVLNPLLEKYNLRLISGWHSSYLLENELSVEIEKFKQHMSFLKAMGCNEIIIAECSGRTYHNPNISLGFTDGIDHLTTKQWLRLTKGLDELASIAEAEGMCLAYHHHMGTVIEATEQINKLMGDTKCLKLLIDTGHMTFAGVNILAMMERHSRRIGHIHLKNIRFNILERARLGKWSFSKAVKEGIFTVPGDGGIDYAPLFEFLSKNKYKGWLVVEAEQDPERANPLDYARKARGYINEMTGL